MRSICPCCSRELTRHEERRYLTAKYTEHYNVGYSVLYLFHCRGRRGCKTEWLMRMDIPLDNRLEPAVSLYYNWAAWRQGQRTKPGLSPLGTTASQYTLLIHEDVAIVYERILERQKKVA